ncbi:hypothetical protein FQN60_004342 [Etheostoma spectabile]|uniref:PHD-type domain-containing protein n=1 Tax=Etheostoma spectabile TaxID=54343 RepID=A0A5J5CTA0_9PERO|nr:hypothetical protein FQN60_004342 [Etheostoma spectabile]
MQYDDHCRVCHRLGDLLCCETCTAVYHLECVKPPLTEVPEDEWQCEICVAHKVPGVTDCVAEAQKNRPYIRQEPIGYDRHQRKYWFLNRRIIVEEDGEHEKKKIWYYSTKAQLSELMECLDAQYWEMDLHATLEEMKEEVEAHMDITEDLTNKARGNNKAYLTAVNATAPPAAEEIYESDPNAGSTTQDEAAPKTDSLDPNKETQPAHSASPESGESPSLAKQESTDKDGKNDSSSEDKHPDDSQDQPQQQSSQLEAGGGSSQVSGLRKPEQPDLEDRSSQSSFTSQDGTDEYNNKAKVDSGRPTGQESKNQTARGSKESSPVRSDGESSRLSFLKRDLMVNLNNLFKLGQEGKYRVYHNQYSTNVLALNKHQHREDHDKRRHLSHKFSLTTASEFKWNGSIYGSRSLTVSTLRLTIIQLETNVPGPFMHPNWASHRTNWNKAVQMCSKAREFALALAILECAIKPVVMLPVWKDSLGHTRLHRMTSMEREDKEKVKKREKKLEDEETLQQATWVKYTIPIKHQVWKQKGEEYRVTGYGGWSWVSKTHVPRFVPKLPGNTNVNYRKELEAKIKKENATACTKKQKKLMETEKQTAQNTLNKDNEEASITASSEEDRKPQTSKVEEKPTEDEQEKKAEEKSKEEKMEVDPCLETTASSVETDQSENKGSVLPSVQPARDEPIQKLEQPKKEETTASKPYYDVVNVSEGFQLRTAYKKKVKPSKLDGLLERRVKQFTLEEKQRLERMRQAALVSKMAATKPTAGVKTEGSTIGKPQPPANLCVKEEKEEVKDHVVKKLDFGQEQMEIKADMDAKSDSAAPNHSKQTEVNAVQGSCGEDLAHKEVNGEPLSSTEPNSKNNFISDAMEGKEKPQKPEVARVGENAKKRAYEEIEQDTGQSIEVDQSKTSPVQVNGRAGENPADSNSNSDPASQVQGEIKEPQKEPVKSLMNGNLLQNDVSDICHPPPLKVPKLENHVAEKGDSLHKNVDVAVASEGTGPTKLPSSSPSFLNSNSTNNDNSSEGLKTSITTNPTTTTEPQNALTTDLPNNISKSNVTSQAAGSAVSSVTTNTTAVAAAPPSSRAVVPQKTKLPVTDTKTGTSTSSMTISKEYSTKDRVSLLRFLKSKKARSGTALPSYRKFVTKSSKKSIFILPNDDLKRMARRAGIREVPIFNYNAKPALDIWPYPSPRPTFGITWRYRLQTVRSLAGVSLMLRLLWACLRWDDMAVKPSAAVGTTRKETTDTDIITTEIIKRRDVGPYGIRSEYCIRKIICPLGNRDTPKETPTPQRKGLRSSALRPKKHEPAKLTGPVAVETWVPEEDLELWEIRAFAERVEREKSQGIDSSKTGSSLKTAEDVKAHLESQLKQARLAAQQKRLEQRPGTPATTPTTTTTTTSASTPSSPSTPTSMGQRTGQVTSGAKMVLASKLSSPAPFQQDKNFHQSFASWVKQGQTNNSSASIGSVATVASSIATSEQTFQIAGSPVTVAGQVLAAKLPLPANSKIVTLNMPTAQGGIVQQKVVGIFPSGPPANLRTYSTLHPTTGNINLRATTSSTVTQQQAITAGGKIQPGTTTSQSSTLSTSVGAAAGRSPAVAQQADCDTDGSWFYACTDDCSSESSRCCTIASCNHPSTWTVTCSFFPDHQATAGSRWKPRSDGGDPGSGSDPGTAANHPTGCNSDPWSWSAANAGSHAQRSGPALPLHSHAPILIGSNVRSPSDPSNPNVNSNSSQSPCASPDDPFRPRPNHNDSPCTCPYTNAKFGPHSSCANPSSSRNPVISTCTISSIHSCSCPATHCSPGLHTGFILHTSLCPRTTPGGKICPFPSRKCRPTYVSDTSLYHSLNPCTKPSPSHCANPSLHPYPLLISYTNPNCSVDSCPGTSCTSSPALTELRATQPQVWTPASSQAQTPVQPAQTPASVSIHSPVSSLPQASLPPQGHVQPPTVVSVQQVTQIQSQLCKFIWDCRSLLLFLLSDLRSLTSSPKPILNFNPKSVPRFKSSPLAKSNKCHTFKHKLKTTPRSEFSFSHKLSSHPKLHYNPLLKINLRCSFSPKPPTKSCPKSRPRPKPSSNQGSSLSTTRRYRLHFKHRLRPNRRLTNSLRSNLHPRFSLRPKLRYRTRSIPNSIPRFRSSSSNRATFTHNLWPCSNLRSKRSTSFKSNRHRKPRSSNSFRSKPNPKSKLSSKSSSSLRTNRKFKRSLSSRSSLQSGISSSPFRASNSLSSFFQLCRPTLLPRSKPKSRHRHSSRAARFPSRSNCSCLSRSSRQGGKFKPTRSRTW